jgi:hypothetical protein
MEDFMNNLPQFSKSISLNKVKNVFQEVLDGKLTREEASNWAKKLQQAEDLGELIYNPKTDEATIWHGITYLLGIDLPNEDGSYLHNNEDIATFVNPIK